MIGYVVLCRVPKLDQDWVLLIKYLFHSEADANSFLMDYAKREDRFEYLIAEVQA